MVTAIRTHAASLLPAHKQWKLVWHDEFDGDTLDMTKWSYRLHIMGHRHLTYTDKAARLDGNSCLHLELLERDGHFYTSQLQTGSNFMDKPSQEFGGEYSNEPGEAPTKLIWPIAHIDEPKFVHRYGYYEIRCKLPTQPGWWAAFWLQSPCIGSTLDPQRSGVEVDIMENFTRDNVINHSIHWDGYGDQHKHIGAGGRKLTDTADGFHVFGVDWSPEGYVYYIDGQESWRVDGPVSHVEQFILLSTECNGYRDGDKPAPILEKAILPDAFVVDYVRVYDEVK
jgi:beta-glucanase (GH16 family)